MPRPARNGIDLTISALKLMVLDGADVQAFTTPADAPLSLESSFRTAAGRGVVRGLNGGLAMMPLAVGETQPPHDG